MECGVTGVFGVPATLSVVPGTSTVTGHVITLHHNMAATTAPEVEKKVLYVP